MNFFLNLNFLPKKIRGKRGILWKNISFKILFYFIVFERNFGPKEFFLALGIMLGSQAPTVLFRFSDWIYHQQFPISMKPWLQPTVTGLQLLFEIGVSFLSARNPAFSLSLPPSSIHIHTPPYPSCQIISSIATIASVPHFSPPLVASSPSPLHHNLTRITQFGTIILLTNHLQTSFCPFEEKCSNRQQSWLQNFAPHGHSFGVRVCF